MSIWRVKKSIKIEPWSLKGRKICCDSSPSGRRVVTFGVRWPQAGGQLSKKSRKKGTRIEKEVLTRRGPLARRIFLLVLALVLNKCECKFAGPTAHGVLGSPSQSLILFSLYFFDNWPPPWGHRAPKLTTRRTTNATFSSLEAPRLDFYRFFGTPNRHRKIDVFSNPQKSTKVSFSIEPLAPKDRFFIKKYDFWPPFWHRFFDFFQKWRKCEISEEYNAKRGSEPSKTSHFRIDF